MEREQLIIVDDASGRMDPDALEAFYEGIAEINEKEKKYIVVGSQSGKLSPEAMAELAKISNHIVLQDIQEQIEIIAAPRVAQSLDEQFIEKINESMKYPVELYQNREARRKAMKEAKRKGRHMF